MKYSVHFGIKKKPNDPSSALIRVRVSWSVDMVEMLTGWQCPTDAWDKATESVKSKKDLKGLHSDIANMSASVNQAFQRWSLDTHIPSKMEVSNLLRQLLCIDTKRDLSLFDAIDRFVSEVGTQNGWSKETCKKMVTLRNHLRNFEPRLDFDDLTEATLSRFLKYLYAQGHRNTNVAKRLSDLRWFCRWAEHEGLLRVHDYADFKPRLKGTDGASKEIIYLEISELMDIYNLDLSSRQGLARSRDVFCFCCFSGLRYSDVAKLTKDDIYDACIHVVTQKTTDRLSIDLNDYTRTILDRYSSDTYSSGSRHNLALPVISNQKMNEELKVIARLAGIDTSTRIVYYKASERVEEVHPKWQLISTTAPGAHSLSPHCSSASRPRS